MKLSRREFLAQAGAAGGAIGGVGAAHAQAPGLRVLLHRTDRDDRAAAQVRS
jgi:hypothetical protein